MSAFLIGNPVKKILAVIVLCFVARPIYAEDSPKETGRSFFEMGGDAYVKQFLINDEPDQIMLDYRDDHARADQEIGLRAHAIICKYLRIDANPYFWHSRENQISRVGLNAEAQVNAFFLGDKLNDRLAVGYGHHSWHNADAKYKGVGGKSQDWFFLEVDVLKLDGCVFS